MELSGKRVVLLIVDGFGIGPKDEGNAIELANTPNWDKLLDNFPMVGVHASGGHVGLPDGYMGNSEVGHLTMGTGRITYQSFELINRACKNNEFVNHPEILNIKSHLHKTGGRLHLMGLLSDGGVHSHQDHLFHLLDILKDEKFMTYVHAFTDGRDTAPRSSLEYVNKLLHRLHEKQKLGSIVGRYYAMDRDKKWHRTLIAYNMLTKMENYEVVDPTWEIQKRYAIDQTDEFFKPIVCDKNGSIKDGDAVLFFNFRPDRARQITQAIHGDWPNPSKAIKDLFYVTMTQYEAGWPYPTLFPPNKIKNSMAEIIANNKLTQAHVAETEKYAHVTYFFNGGEEDKFPGEERVLIPSLQVATYDLEPEMSTMAIARATVDQIKRGSEDLKRRHAFIVLNIAAPDMVGHTGVLPATIRAVEVMDDAFGMIWEACKKEDYILCITADHGNAEKMLNNGEPHTAHTTNLVPFLVTADIKLKEDGGLQNIIPTILELMGLNKPEDMTGESLISK